MTKKRPVGNDPEQKDFRESLKDLCDSAKTMLEHNALEEASNCSGKLSVEEWNKKWASIISQTSIVSDEDNVAEKEQPILYSNPSLKQDRVIIGRLCSTLASIVERYFNNEYGVVRPSADESLEETVRNAMKRRLSSYLGVGVKDYKILFRFAWKGIVACESGDKDKLDVTCAFSIVVSSEKGQERSDFGLKPCFLKMGIRNTAVSLGIPELDVVGAVIRMVLDYQKQR